MALLSIDETFPMTQATTGDFIEALLCIIKTQKFPKDIPNKIKIVNNTFKSTRLGSSQVCIT